MCVGAYVCRGLCRLFMETLWTWMSGDNEDMSRLISAQLQSNFDGSNTFGTMKICWRQE